MYVYAFGWHGRVKFFWRNSEDGSIIVSCPLYSALRIKASVYTI